MVDGRLGVIAMPQPTMRKGKSVKNIDSHNDVMKTILFL